MKLYHYTDLNGLKGIVESQALWATSLHFLNDSEELKHGMECIKNALLKFKGNIPRDYYDSIMNAMNRYSLRQFENVYNISFCQESELLSQWRGYANTQGVCIQFDSDDLMKTLDLDCCDHELAAVVYSAKDKALKAETQLVNLFDKFNLYHGAFIQKHAKKFVSSMTPFFKNDRFSEEKEYRIVVYPFSGLHEVKFRVSKNGLIPYIELNAKVKEAEKDRRIRDGSIPIDKVTVAPSANAEFIKGGVRRFLDLYSYKDTIVDTSLTPYRG